MHFITPQITQTGRALALAFGCALAGPVSGHMVPWDESDPAYDPLRQDNKPELAYQLARYCYLIDEDPEQCVFDLLKEDRHQKVGRLVAYAQCMAKIEEVNPELEMILHGTGVGKHKSCIGSLACSWHGKYVDDRPLLGDAGDGDHYHKYSQAQAHKIATDHANQALATYVANYTSTTVGTLSAKERSQLQRIQGGVKIGPLSSEAMSQTGQKETGSTTKTQTGPSDAQRKAEFERAYQVAQSALFSYAPKSVLPAITCERGKATCTSVQVVPKAELKNLDHPLHQPTTNFDTQKSSPNFPLPKVHEPPAPDPDGGQSSPDYFPVAVDVSKGFVTPGDPAAFRQDIKACVAGMLAPDLTMDIEEAGQRPDGRPACVIAAEALETTGVCDPACFSQEFCQLYKLRKVVDIVGSEPDDAEEAAIDPTELVIKVEPPADVQARLAYCADLQALIDQLEAGAFAVLSLPEKSDGIGGSDGGGGDAAGALDGGQSEKALIVRAPAEEEQDDTPLGFLKTLHAMHCTSEDGYGHR